MSGYSSKVHKDDGGDSLAVEAGGSVTIGNITLTVSADGGLVAIGLPTADPHVAGQVWSNSGALTVSGG